MLKGASQAMALKLHFAGRGLEVSLVSSMGAVGIKLRDTASAV